MENNKIKDAKENLEDMKGYVGPDIAESIDIILNYIEELEDKVNNGK